MPFKINVSHKGKTLKKELDSEALIGKTIGETIQGSQIGAELAGYELQITGTSDKSGFPGKKEIEGPELRKALLTKGFSLKRKPKGLTKKTKKASKGLRMKKTLRGNTISSSTIQINTIVKKEGTTAFDSLVPKKEAKAKTAEEAGTEKPAEKQSQ
jgi:small subunit ribosomal protein S6e